MRNVFGLLSVLCVLGSSAHAHAFYDLRVGAKGSVNGVAWAAPDNSPPGSAALWGDNQFLMGGGGGLFGDLRLFKLLGLELDLLFESNKLTFNYSVGALSYDYDTKFLQFRAPILAKLCLPLGPLEMTFGFGPEFVKGMNADVTVSDAVAQPFYAAEPGSDTFLNFDWALNVRLGKLFIPIGLRFRLNVTQPSEYADRVTVEPTAAGLPKGTVDAIESYSFGLNLGLGWVFFDDDDEDEDEDEDDDEDD
jgi:hypothetical protein